MGCVDIFCVLHEVSKSHYNTACYTYDRLGHVDVWCIRQTGIIVLISQYIRFFVQDNRLNWCVNVSIYVYLTGMRFDMVA